MSKAEELESLMAVLSIKEQGIKDRASATKASKTTWPYTRKCLHTTTNACAYTHTPD